MEQSDAVLVQECRRGNSAAWETLVQRYQRLIFSIPRRSGLDEELSAEVFQYVFTTLVEQLPNIQQPDRIKAWLVTTARRETWRVSKQARSTLSLTSADDESNAALRVPDDEPLPEETLIRLEEQHTVFRAVAALDERCRELLWLLFYSPERPAYAEIAARLGTSEGSIGPTRARCLEKVRRSLIEDTS